MENWLEKLGLSAEYSFAEMFTNIATAFVVIVIAVLAKKLLCKLIARQESKGLDKTITPLLQSTATGFTYAIAAAIILETFGVNANSIIAVLGAAGLAIGLALKDTLSNIAAGIMLIVLRPMKVDDYIVSDSVSGNIKKIGLFATELKTLDGVYISAPNNAIWNSPIKNFSRNSTRRVDIVVGIDYSDSIDTAIDVLRKIAENEKRILPSPSANFFVQSMGDSCVNIQFRVWVEKGDYWGVLADMNKEIKENIEAAGLSIPFPQTAVTFQNQIGVDSSK